MAGKFIDLKAAAKQLGITPEHLQELREAGKVHGYKDGLSWKFKLAEIQRLTAELAADADDFELSDSSALSGGDFDRLLKGDDAAVAADAGEHPQDSSVLISGGQPEENEESSSTVIGQKIADDLSEIQLAADSDEKSDLKLADRGAKQMPGPAGLGRADSADLSDELRAGDDLEFESDEGLLLPGDASKASLSAESSDQDVLEDSDGSELPIGAGDSSIGLASPSDSGLPLEKASSSAALELPEDDDMISLEDDLSASGDATRLQQDEEFLLSPSDEILGDESSDSGSQVIALDESGAFEGEVAVGLEEVEPLLVADEADSLGVHLAPIDEAALVAARAVGVGGPELAEVPYSPWNLLALVFVVLLLVVSGMLMADVVRNMWTWNGESGLAGGVANAIVDALGMNN